MIHPEDLLATAVDGALTDPERAELDAHLAGCERCRHELELASRARDELSGLPEVPAPIGFASAVETEAERPVMRPSSGAVPDTSATSWPPPQPRRKRPVAAWVAGLAAAAAIVGFFALVVLPRGENLATTGKGGAEAARAPSNGGHAPLKGFDYVLVQPKADYDAGQLQALARQIATGKNLADVSAGTGYTPGSTSPSPTPSAAASGESPSPQAGQARKASPGLVPASPQIAACIQQGAQIQQGDRVAQVIQARFGGTPAYIVALSQERSDAPAKVIVWVVAKDTCGLLSYTQFTK